VSSFYGKRTFISEMKRPARFVRSFYPHGGLRSRSRIGAAVTRLWSARAASHAWRREAARHNPRGVDYDRSPRRVAVRRFTVSRRRIGRLRTPAVMGSPVEISVACRAPVEFEPLLRSARSRPGGSRPAQGHRAVLLPGRPVLHAIFVTHCFSCQGRASRATRCAAGVREAPAAVG
jgi:hypothetical protein